MAEMDSSHCPHGLDSLLVVSPPLPTLVPQHLSQRSRCRQPSLGDPPGLLPARPDTPALHPGSTQGRSLCTAARAPAGQQSSWASEQRGRPGALLTGALDTAPPGAGVNDRGLAATVQHRYGLTVRVGGVPEGGRPWGVRTMSPVRPCSCPDPWSSAKGRHSLASLILFCIT